MTMTDLPALCEAELAALKARTCDTCQMQSASLDPLCVRVEKPCSVLGGGCFAWLAREGGVAGRVDVARLVAQAHAISSLLSEAGVGPCSLPEGVRLLMNDRDQLKEKHPAMLDELETLRAGHAQLRAALVALVGMDTIEELDAMEAFLRVVPGAAQDKATMIDAIHALKAVRP